MFDKNNGSAGGRYERGGETCRVVEVQREERRVVMTSSTAIVAKCSCRGRSTAYLGERMRVRVSIAPAD